jgi:hypothetical protein
MIADDILIQVTRVDTCNTAGHCDYVCCLQKDLTAVEDALIESGVKFLRINLVSG